MITPAQVQAFHDAGHVVLRGVVEPSAVRGAATAARALTEAALAASVDPASATAPTHALRPTSAEYLSLVSVGSTDPVLATLVRAVPLARAAAVLMGVDAVRLYHDELFVKPAGAPPTFWHRDQPYWPVDACDVVGPGGVGMVRLWLALTDLSASCGTLRFASGSHRTDPGDATRTGHPDRARSVLVGDEEFPVHDAGPFTAGDATVHAAGVLHAAGANRSDEARYALTIAYLADGARVAEPASEVQEANIDLFLDSRHPGDLIDGPSNPVLWSASGHGEITTVLFLLLELCTGRLRTAGGSRRGARGAPIPAGRHSGRRPGVHRFPRRRLHPRRSAPRRHASGTRGARGRATSGGHRHEGHARPS
ncbi:MAG: phytanoyl-CoA dioxygenase family protein [Acidimicrobiia bacterium]|nr:phytanoyl-CoA dioxygenase family protein [Acidimicrobiia bacterium]